MVPNLQQSLQFAVITFIVDKIGKESRNTESTVNLLLHKIKPSSPAMWVSMHVEANTNSSHASGLLRYKIECIFHEI